MQINNAVLERNEPLVTLFCPFQKIKPTLNGETIHKCRGAVVTPSSYARRFTYKQDKAVLV